ncbi:MAG: serine/threonine protein kinase, partial [Planctomycetaceae bacterium]
MRVPGCRWLRLILLLLFLGGVGVGRPILEAQEWARFRGVNGSGLSTAASLPIRWSESENLAWKLDLAGEGSSSPVLWEDRIFLTCSRMPADRGAVPQRSLLCVDAVSGRLQWSVEAP